MVKNLHGGRESGARTDGDRCPFRYVIVPFTPPETPAIA